MSIAQTKVHVFDNGGKTPDRYTIILPNGDVFGASEHPFQGFGNFCANVQEDYRQDLTEYIKKAQNNPDFLGKEVDIETLTTDLQQYIAQLSYD